MRVTIQNNREHDVELLYLETMPWLVTFYLHTLALTVGGARRGKHAFSQVEAVQS